MNALLARISRHGHDAFASRFRTVGDGGKHVLVGKLRVLRQEFALLTALREVQALREYRAPWPGAARSGRSFVPSNAEC